MNWEALIIFGAFSIILGIVLLVPGLMWARRDARLNANTLGGMAVTKSGFIFYGFSVGTFFAGFAAPYFAPGTVFGKWMSTHLGWSLFVVAILGIGVIAELLLKSAGIKIVAPVKRSDA